MARLTYTKPLLILGVLALTACPGDDTTLETDSASSGDESTTGNGPTTTPPTSSTSTTDDTVDSTSTTGDDPCANVECPPGQECIGGSCFTCGLPTCDSDCPMGEVCECPDDDECCDVGMCVPLDCPGDALPGNYEPCLTDGVPDDTPCDGAACIVDNDANPQAGVCMVLGCEYSCQCPPHPGTGDAVVTCEDVTGDDVSDCWIDCGGGATCPDGMSCFGGFICIWSDSPETPLYGDCFNGSPICADGGFCLGAGPDGAFCSGACGDVGDCQPPPATGDATIQCLDVTMDGMPECWLGCMGGETCPDDMYCYMDFICLWPEIIPPGDNYGDCFNWPGGCEAGEDACINDNGMMPMAGACSQSGCADAMDCPAAPASGNAPVACGDLGGGNTCLLDCSMGETCPDGMACTTVDLGMGMSTDVCMWPDHVEDFTCSDGDLGSAVGMAVSMGTTVGAGDDYIPSCSGGNDEDVELQWTAPADGTYTFDTVGSSIDTILTIFPDCVTPEVACNDDINPAMMNFQSTVTLDVPAGQTVLIVIDGWNESGNYVLNIN
ncbi:hypothetical protein [Paraliomyxa miuraensis]|uniref:hypothetical protein n=1 Tax=Paraliomyxa miuraensis TaxID=376150 RepID=UPI00225C1700|nr:hypothetical protein [Paraliomyxa miuraensis]MCX4246030.1 hypothetical protein [Paraliomyxa miuraensis]